MLSKRLKPEVIKALRRNEIVQLQLANHNKMGNKTASLSTIKRWCYKNEIYLTFYKNLEIIKDELFPDKDIKDLIEDYDTELFNLPNQQEVL